MAKELMVDGLTDKQAEFVRLFTAGVSQTQAAKQAGYSKPAVDGWRLLQTPSVIAAVREESERALSSAVPAALSTLVELLGPKNAGTVRLGAAKTILDRTGFVEQKSGDDAGAKTLSEMTERDLEALASKLRRSARSSERSAQEPVDVTPEPVDKVE